MASELNQIIRMVEAQGWTVEQRRRSGHLVFTSPSGDQYFTGGSPSDHRHKKKLIADLRKMGLEYDASRGSRRRVRKPRRGAGDDAERRDE